VRTSICAGGSLFVGFGEMRTLITLAIALLAVGGYANFVVEQASGAAASSTDEGVELLQLRGEQAKGLAEAEGEVEAEAAEDDEDEDDEADAGQQAPLLMEEPNILESHDLLKQVLLQSDDALVVALVEGSVEPEDLDDDDLAHLSMYQEDDEDEQEEDAQTDDEQEEETETDDEARWGLGRRRRRFSMPHISIHVSLPPIPKIPHIPTISKAAFVGALKKVGTAAIAGAKWVAKNPLGAIQCAKCLQSACLCLAWKSCPPCAEIMKKLLEFAKKKIGHRLDAQMAVFQKFKGEYTKLMDSPIGKFAKKYGKYAKDLSNPSALINDVSSAAQAELKARGMAEFEKVKAKAKAKAKEEFEKTGIYKKVASSPLGDYAKKYGKYIKDFNDPTALANDMKSEAIAEAKRRAEDAKSYVNGKIDQVAEKARVALLNALSKGYCNSGVRAGRACCAKSCGQCGGKGCQLRPGGGAKCCHGKVKARPCNAHSDTACFIPTSLLDEADDEEMPDDEDDEEAAE